MSSAFKDYLMYSCWLNFQDEDFIYSHSAGYIPSDFKEFWSRKS